MIIDFQSRASIPTEEPDLDVIFEDCKGVFESVVILGYDKDGGMRIAGAFDIANAVALMERAKFVLLLGDGDD